MMMEVAAMIPKSKRIPVLKRKIAMALKHSQDMIENCIQSDGLRLNEKAFTRESPLGPKRLLRMILLRIYRSIQLFLDDFYEETGEKPVTKQAFSKARKYLNPEYVRSFVDMTSRIAADDEDKATYNGMPLIAIDGSDVALENTPELRAHFGCSGSKRDAATALASTAFDPLNSVIYDCRIAPYGTSERTLAKQHIERLLELGLAGSILLFDRGYPSAEFIAYLYNLGFQFIMRVREKFNLESDAIETQGWINLTHNGKEYPVRVLKVALSTGGTETLFTSFNQKQLPIRAAGPLYFERWGVETAYDMIKSKLELENFSGKTIVSVLQDFYATMYLANMVAFAAEEADKIINENDEGKGLKFFRKSNRSRTVDKLRKRFLKLITMKNEKKRTRELDALAVDIARFPVQIVSKPPGTIARKIPRKKRFFQARRSVV